LKLRTEMYEALHGLSVAAGVPLNTMLVIKENGHVKQKLKVVAIAGNACDVLGYVPSVAVGVVGIGHMPGIIANWNETTDIQQLLQ